MRNILGLTVIAMIHLCLLAGCANAQDAGPVAVQPTVEQQQVGPGLDAAAQETQDQRYIVIFDDTLFSSSGNDVAAVEARVQEASTSLAGKYGATILATWSRALRGMSVEMSPESASSMARDPMVREVKIDRPIRLDPQHDQLK